MIKIAVIFESSPFDRKGLFNAVHNRILNLLKTGECTVDAFCIHSWDSAFTRKVRHTHKVTEMTPEVVVDGIRYRMLWYDFSIIDHVTVEKLEHEPYFFNRFIRRCLPLLSGYDVLSAHAFSGGLLAYEAHLKYGTPYFMNWHGSDIHRHPWRNRLIMKRTAGLMKGASYNFFVSRALMEYSDRILSGVKKEVLYNGVSDSFVRFHDYDRMELRLRYGLEDQVRVVTFAGNLSEVKNVRLLQPIFHEIRKKFKGELDFWIIGDGKLRAELVRQVEADDSISVRMFGNRPPEEMPLLMNCTDVLILPSRNEGLGMVCAEAIRCGANAVGADVGGIKEVVGKDFTVPHGDGFVIGMAEKVVACLESDVMQQLSPDLDWRVTAERELSFIKEA